MKYVTVIKKNHKVSACISFIEPLLEARAEILKNFRWFFGRNDETKRTFQNLLTFTGSKIPGTIK